MMLDFNQDVTIFSRWIGVINLGCPDKFVQFLRETKPDCLRAALSSLLNFTVEKPFLPPNEKIMYRGVQSQI